MGDAKSIQDPVVKALAAHICSFPFQRSFEEFFLKNALSFTDEVEHQLGYMTIYLEFQQLFNRQMEDFLTKQGLDEEEFSAICQRAIEEDQRADNFLEIVLASMDYDAFYQLMKTMRARAAAEGKRKRKDAGDDDGGKGGEDDDEEYNGGGDKSCECSHADHKATVDNEDEESEGKDAK